MPNFQVNIANVTAHDMAEWLADNMMGTFFNIEDTLSMWEGAVEPGVRITFWDVDRLAVTLMLSVYGEQNPDEEAFGLMELPASQVLHNPYHQK